MSNEKPAVIICPRCKEPQEPDFMLPDGCRDPDCPLLYGDNEGTMTRLFEQIASIGK